MSEVALMIDEPTTMAAWKSALRHIKEEGRIFSDDEHYQCREVNNMIVTVGSLKDAKSPLQWIRANGDWLYPSDDELRDALFARTGEEDTYAYGPRIFSFRGELDQLDGYIIPLLRAYPESRRAMIVLADPVADEVTVSRNFVSLLSVWFRIIDGKLEVTAAIRSNDFLLGWPANAYQVGLLQQYVAEKIGVAAGRATTISFSGHYFLNEDALVQKLVR